jgi:hypothetical protein
MAPYWMSCSLRILADSSNSSSLIQEGISQCSLGINSRHMLVVSLSFYSASHTISTFCFCLCLCPSLEVVAEWHIVEKCPRIIEFRIPRSLEVSHCLNHPADFLVPNQRQKCRIDSCCSFSTKSISFPHPMKYSVWFPRHY